MGVDVYLENQIHGRTHAGSDIGTMLSRVLAKANSDGLLAGIDMHGDTMFNVVQLQKVDLELDAIAEAYPDLRSDVSSLKQILENVIRSRGYLWLAGD